MRIVLILTLLSLCISSFAQDDYQIGYENKDGYTSVYKNLKIAEGNYYASAKYANRYGLIETKTQQLVLPLQYQSVYTSYEDGLYIVKDTLNMYGLFNAKTKTFIVEPAYIEMEGFYEGVAKVSKAVPGDLDYMSGAIDKDGKLVIPIEYEHVGYSSDGLLSVKKAGKYGFVDHQNKMVIPAIYDQPSTFRNGLAPVSLSDSSQYGYINKDNVFVIPQQYVYADDFYGGYATVYKAKAYTKNSGNVANEIGVIDVTGKMIIEPLYDYISFNPKGSLFIVRKKEMYGLADTTGKIVLPVAYKKINDFTDNGYAIVQEVAGTKGLVDNKGAFVLKPDYIELYESYNNSNRLVGKKDGKYIVFDNKDLKVLIQPDTAKNVLVEKNNMAYVYDNMVKIFDEKGKFIKTISQDKLSIYGVKFIGKEKKDSIVLPYFATMAVINLLNNNQVKISGYELGDYNEEGVFVVKDLSYTFYDYTGKRLTPKRFENVVNFSEGICGLQDNNYTKPYLADKNFNKIVEISNVFYGPFSEGLALTKGQYDGNLYYIDKTGKTVFGIKGKEGYQCKNGRILINNADKYFYVNRSGKVLNAETYDILGAYSNGLAGFRSDGKYGYIDTLDKEVIEAKYDGATDFSGDAALVVLGKDYFLINKKGQPVNADKYISAEAGANGTFPVKKAKGWGLINSKGVKIVDFIYEAILPKSNDMIWAKKNGKWGALNALGVPVTAFEFDNIENFNNGYAKVQKNQKLGLINKMGKVVLPAQFDKLSSVYKNTIVTYLPSGSTTVSIK